MTFEELGQALKAGREAKGLSLEDVAEKIKVSARILRHIEEGNRASLPHAVYTRGFILSYAGVIDIPQNELLSALNTHLPNADEACSVPQPLPVYPKSSNFYSRVAVLVVVILVLAGLLAGGWFIYDRHGKTIIDFVKSPFSALTSSEPASETSVPVVSPVAEGETGAGFFLGGNATASATTPVQAEPANASFSANASGVNAASTAEASPEPAPAVPIGQGGAPETGTNTGSAEFSVAGERQVHLQATARCWVRSQADGGLGHEFTMKPGESTVLPYKARLKLTLGNPAGVKIKDNGKEYKGKLDNNKPATLEFPAT